MNATDLSTPDLLRRREADAAALEAAMVACGAAFTRYARTTAVLEQRLDLASLARALDGPIVLHAAQAGLGSLLESKLAGPRPAPLRDIVARQHRSLVTENRSSSCP